MAICFSLLHSPDGRLALRLSETDREKFLKQYKTMLFEAFGVVIKEYVAVPDTLLAKTKELGKYLLLSHEYAKTLKAKTNQEETLIT